MTLFLILFVCVILSTDVYSSEVFTEFKTLMVARFVRDLTVDGESCSKYGNPFQKLNYIKNCAEMFSFFVFGPLRGAGGWE